MTKLKTKSQSRATSKITAVGKPEPSRKSAKITKKARLIRLLSKDAGSDITSISKRFGWLPHTTRAALSRLRKAGYEITSVKAGSGRLCHVKCLRTHTASG